MSNRYNKDRAGGGPTVGAEVRQRALAAAPESEEPPWQVEWRQRRADYEAAKLAFATAATEMVKEVLGENISLEPEDWKVVIGAPGNADSGDGIPETNAYVKIDGVRVYARAEDDGPQRIMLDDYIPLTLATFGRALARRQ